MTQKLEKKLPLFRGGTMVSPLYVTQDSLGFKVGLRPEQVNGVPAEQTVLELFLLERKRQTGYDQGLCKMRQGELIDYLWGGYSANELERLAHAAVSQVQEKAQERSENLERYQLVDYALGALLAHQHEEKYLG